MKNPKQQLGSDIQILAKELLNQFIETANPDEKSLEKFANQAQSDLGDQSQLVVV